MGKFVDSVMSGECFIPPSKTKVLQFFDADGTVRGESFEFVGRPKPNTEEFKAKCLELYPNGKFKKLKKSESAISNRSWVANFSDLEFKGAKQLPPKETIKGVNELLQEWEAKTETYSLLDKEIRANFAQIILAGNFPTVEPHTCGSYVLNCLLYHGAISPK